jgi:Protein of unknown function (DUF4239)
MAGQPRTGLPGFHQFSKEMHGSYRTRSPAPREGTTGPEESVMSSLTIACILFACVFVAGMLAMWAARSLPGHHLAGDSKDAAKQGLALIMTLTALVLGLLVATTKGTFDTQSSAVNQLAGNVVLLDRILARYGPETKEARELLRTTVGVVLEDIWPDESARPGSRNPAEATAVKEALFDKVADLAPKTEAQTLLKARALAILIDIAQTRERMIAQKESSIPLLFLVVLGFWLVILFAGYGLLAPRNPTVITILIVCMLSISGAVFLVLELDRPFEGTVRVSSAPLRAALSRVGE